MPRQSVAWFTDIGPERSKLFGNSADEYLEVHDQGPRHADVTAPGQDSADLDTTSSPRR